MGHAPGPAPACRGTGTRVGASPALVAHHVGRMTHSPIWVERLPRTSSSIEARRALHSASHLTGATPLVPPPPQPPPPPSPFFPPQPTKLRCAARACKRTCQKHPLAPCMRPRRSTAALAATRLAGRLRQLPPSPCTRPQREMPGRMESAGTQSHCNNSSGIRRTLRASPHGGSAHTARWAGDARNDGAPTPCACVPARLHGGITLGTTSPLWRQQPRGAAPVAPSWHPASRAAES